MLLWLKLGLTPAFFSGILLVSFLIAAAFIDLNTMEIPDSITIPATVLGVIFNGLFNNVFDGLAGAAVGFGFIYLLSLLGRYIFKKDAIGDGDAMLFMMIGANLGIAGIFGSIFLSFLIGGIVGSVLLLSRLKKFGEEVPFGPMIAAGAVIYLFIRDFAFLKGVFYN